MRYTPDWVSLADALKRVIETGTEEETKADLCHAVADAKIRVRVRIAAIDRELGGQFLHGDNVQVPPLLKPDDFDWEQSRPRHRWSVGPAGPQSYTRPYWTWERREIDLIELATSDVQHIFGSPVYRTPGGVAPKKRSAGRRSKYAASIHQAVFKLMDYNGDLTDDDPEWSVQADVEKAVREQFGEKGPRAISTVRQHVSSAIAKWRS